MSLLFDYTETFFKSNNSTTKMHDLVEKWKIGIKDEQYRHNTLSEIKDTLLAIYGIIFFYEKMSEKQKKNLLDESSNSDAIKNIVNYFKFYENLSIKTKQQLQHIFENLKTFDIYSIENEFTEKMTEIMDLILLRDN